VEVSCIDELAYVKHDHKNGMLNKFLHSLAHDRIKVQFSLLYAMKVQRASRDIVLRSLIFDIRLIWVVSAILRPL